MDAIQIDKMTNTDFDKYWLDKDGTVLTKNGRTGPTFERCRTIVQAFLSNPGNRDLLGSCRPGVPIKATTLVAEGETLTRDLWLSLSGYGREITPAARTA